MVLDSSSENRRLFLDVTALVKVLANKVNSEMDIYSQKILKVQEMIFYLIGTCNGETKNFRIILKSEDEE